MLFSIRTRRAIPWEVVDSKSVEPVPMYYDEDLEGGFELHSSISSPTDNCLGQTWTFFALEMQTRAERTSLK